MLLYIRKFIAPLLPRLFVRDINAPSIKQGKARGEVELNQQPLSFRSLIYVGSWELLPAVSKPSPCWLCIMQDSFPEGQGSPGRWLRGQLCCKLLGLGTHRRGRAGIPLFQWTQSVSSYSILSSSYKILIRIPILKEAER